MSRREFFYGTLSRFIKTLNIDLEIVDFITIK
jgi:hypothetical protein